MLLISVWTWEKSNDFQIIDETTFICNNCNYSNKIVARLFINEAFSDYNSNNVFIKGKYIENQLKIDNLGEFILLAKSRN